MAETEQKPRILAVDDSRVMRVALRRILSKEYDVIEAENGEDAWTYLINDSSIQTVFTDLNMPYLDGYGLLARMRESDDEKLQDMPVIIITGKEDDDDAKQQALDNGASDFISKPFESIQLLARAKAHVKFKQTTTKLTDVSEKLEHQATVDEITGLGGQRYFCKVAEETLAHIKRHGGQYVLIRMDIDHFNQLFIKSGKPIADGILKAVGQQLIKIVRQEDMLARIGLSKFSMLLRDIPLDKATEIAQRINSAVSSLTFKMNGQDNLKISASTVVYEPDIGSGKNIKEQIEIAEAHLTELIKTGGNQFATHSDSNIIKPEHVNIETALSMLSNNDDERLQPQKEALLARVFPLLNFFAKEMGSEFKNLIEKILPGDKK